MKSSSQYSNSLAFTGYQNVTATVKRLFVNMAQDKGKSSSDGKQTGDNFKPRAKKDKQFQSKVVVRRLPPTMTEDQFLDQISPVPDHDYFHFVKADMRLGQYAFSRAYLNFTQQDDIYLFKEKFDEYVFLDSKGNEYPAIVEFAPFQKIPKKRSKKRDSKCGTIETDPDYLAFLESLKKPEESSLPTAEVYLEEIESREKELKANNGVPKITTPLIEYLKQRKIEIQKIKEEKREERKRKDLEKKRLREEERRRRKAERDRKNEKSKDKESFSEKEITEENEELPVPEDSKQQDPVVQVLKNPEREKEQKEHITPLKNKGYFMWSNKDKDRTKKEWERDADRRERDKIRPKERTRPNERLMVRDKDRGRREKTDHKSHSGHKPIPNESKNNTEDSAAAHQGEVPVNDTESTAHTTSTKAKRDKSCPGNVETTVDEGTFEEDRQSNDFSYPSKNGDGQSEMTDSTKSDGYSESKEQSKDPRLDRRIKNKDRPSLEIYRPGMRRFSTQRNSPQKEISTSTSNSSTPSPSPTPPLVMASSKVQVRDNEKGKSRKPPFSGDVTPTKEVSEL